MLHEDAPCFVFNFASKPVYVCIEASCVEASQQLRGLSHKKSNALRGVARDFKVIARVRAFGQPGEWHVDVATIRQGAEGEIMFDEIDNQLHKSSLCRGLNQTARVLDIVGVP
jgi:hypothetical protein